MEFDQLRNVCCMYGLVKISLLKKSLINQISNHWSAGYLLQFAALKTKVSQKTWTILKILWFLLTVGLLAHPVLWLHVFQYFWKWYFREVFFSLFAPWELHINITLLNVVVCDPWLHPAFCYCLSWQSLILTAPDLLLLFEIYLIKICMRNCHISSELLQLGWIVYCTVQMFFDVLYVQTVEYFAWNVRVLKGQADLLRHAQNTCCEDMKQVHLKLQCHLAFVFVWLLWCDESCN